MVWKQFIEESRKIQRALEILPGAVSWSLILFLTVGSFFLPHYVAALIIIFDIYWLYKSVNISITSLVSHYKIKAAMVYDWKKDLEKQKDWEKVHHIIIIPTYQEPLRVLESSIETMANQELDPKKHISVVVAFEKREKEAFKKEKILKEKFGKSFAHLFFTHHPDLKGEVKGKSSNEAWAGKWVKKQLVDKEGYDMDFLTVTSADADTCFHSKYFLALSYGFLTNPKKFRRFWHAAIWYYSNIWDVPAPVRIISTFNSVWRTAVLVRRDLLIHTSVYSLSLKMLHEVGYWDVNVIPEDYRIFFKCFFTLEEQVEVEPIFLPIYVDAPQSSTYWKTLVNQYEQMKRWAWGTSDDAYLIKKLLTSGRKDFIHKLVRVIQVLEDHFLWPVNWFFITLGANIPVILNPVFAQTVMGRNLPTISFFILSLCWIGLAVILFVEFKQRPKKENMSKIRLLFQPFEFILMPFVGLFFNALPGIDAHTRLMLGKYIEYKVTEKV